VCGGNKYGRLWLWDSLAVQAHQAGPLVLGDAPVVCFATGNSDTLWVATADSNMHVISGSAPLNIAGNVGKIPRPTGNRHWAFVAAEARPAAADALLHSLSSFGLQFEHANFAKTLSRFAKEAKLRRGGNGGAQASSKGKRFRPELLSLKMFRFFCTMRFAELLGGLVYSQSLGADAKGRKLCISVR
jgi:hypothetical protein